VTLGKYMRMLLTSDAGVAALVADRVFTEVLPQAPLVPAVVFTEVAGDEDVALEGPTGASSRRVQVDSWAKTRADATTLGLAVKRALSRHVGAAAGLDVQALFFLTERWDYDSDSALYRTSQDFECWISGDAA
jgi:hypothetical protein